MLCSLGSNGSCYRRSTGELDVVGQGQVYFRSLQVPTPILRTAGCAIISFTLSGASALAVLIKLSTPLGSPAYVDVQSIGYSQLAARRTLCRTSTTNACVRGVDSEHLKTTVLPQRIATATARKLSTNGMFHGEIDRLQ